MKVMAEEIEALICNHVWRLELLLPGRKTIGVWWLFKLKWHANGMTASKHDG
jgi:hypothetical protein